MADLNTITLGIVHLRDIWNEWRFCSNSLSKITADIKNKIVVTKVNSWNLGNNIKPLGVPKKMSNTEKIIESITK